MQLPQNVVLDTAHEVRFLMERFNLLPANTLLTIEQLLKWCIEANGDMRMPAFPALLAKIKNALLGVGETERLAVDEACVLLTNKIHSVLTRHNLWTPNGISNYSFQLLLEGGDIQVGLGINYGTPLHNPDLGSGTLDQSSGLSF